MKVLLVEDDQKLVELLEFNLKENGFSVQTATHLSAMDDVLKSENAFDVVVLDRLLHNQDSKDSIVTIKNKWPQVSIMILSAISTPNERTDLLNLGADDYLGKPFSTSELVARLNVLIRRSKMAQNTTYIRLGNLVLNTITRTISVENKSDLLPAKEFLLFRAMAQDCTKIWSKNQLLDHIWGQTTDIETNVVESTITNLRRRLADLNANISIKNMRNTGYWIEA